MQMKFRRGFLTIILGVVALELPPVENVRGKNIEEVITVSEENLRTDMEALTAQSRETGTKGNQIAREYLVKRLSELGYETKQQKFSYNDAASTAAFEHNEDKNLFFRVADPQEEIDGTGVNIIGTKGEKELPTLILSAHYDTTEGAVGANDNASGIAAVLEAARILDEEEPAFNLELVFFDAEEEYIVGSRYYMSELEEKNLLGNINVDSIGDISEGGVWAAVAEYDACTGEDGSYQQKPVENSLSVLFTENQDAELVYEPSSDHLPFSMVGIPSVTIAQSLDESITDIINSPEDTMENIDMNRIAQTTEMLVEAVKNLE